MRSRLYSIYFFIITILLISAIGAAIYILLLEYDSLIATVTTTVHKNGLEEKLRNGIFTRNRFTLLQRMSWLVFVLAPFCFWLATRYRYFITGYCRFLFTSVSQSVKAIVYIFKNNSPQENKSLFALMGLVVLFFIVRITTSFLTYDEMWSYNYYTDHPFYYSFFTYSNYPLFEMTTHFFKWLPFSMKINLRLSPFIFGTASCFLLYACLKKYFNHHFTAMAGVIAFAFTPLTVVFMASARGVMHELFFAIAGIFSLLFWLENPGRKIYMGIYFLAAVLGVYSMSTHVLLLLFLLVIGLWTLVKRNRASAVLFVRINLFILGGIMLMYAPMVLTTGSAVFEDVVKRMPSYDGVIARLPDVMRNVIMGYTGYHYINVVVFSAAIVMALLLKNKLPGRLNFILMLAVGLPVSTVLFYLITRFPYAGRSLAFGALSIPLLTCLFVQMAASWLTKNKIWANAMAGCSIVLALLLDSYFYLPVNPVDKNVAAVSRLLIDNKTTSCYDNSLQASGFFYYYPGIEYYYRLENKTIAFTLAQKNSMRYKPLLPGDSYDCMVYDASSTDSSRAGAYHEVYRDPAAKFKIWIRNDSK
jgi:hypothetical protein